MWSIPRTLIKFWVSGHLKMRWVLDGYSGRFWGGSGGGKLGAKIDQVGPKRPVCPKKSFIGEFFWQLKKRGQLKKPKGCHATHLHPQVGALGGG